MWLGLDISAQYTAAILANAGGETQVALRAALSPNADSHATWQLAMQTAREVFQRAGVEGAAIERAAVSFAAPLDADGVVPKDARFPGWANFDFPRATREQLGIVEVVAAPRVLCEALGEEKFGALRVPVANAANSPDAPASTLNAVAAHSPDWVFVHIGTHLAAAARVNGQLLRGAQQSALDFGALCIERDGALSASGRRGELEAYCGSEAFLERARSYSILLHQASEIWNLTESNFAAKSLCDDYVSRLAQGLGLLLSMFNPPRLVLGGSLVEALGETLLGPLRLKLHEFCRPRHYQNLALTTSTLRGDAAVLGAVVLAQQNLET